ncbi:N-acetylmuramoyl-L-alanine amidase, partial [Streptomyces sp. NPDC005576]
TFGPVRMFLNHHTAGRNAKDTVAKNGVSGLPGPLAHVYLARSGVATMCSAGRANHAGKMGAAAFASFRDEKTIHPMASASAGTIDGNDVSYGIETENLGDEEDVYPRVQYDAWVRINAAVCRHHGWSAESVGCHKETSVEGKVDPRGPVEGYGTRGRFAFTPHQFRVDVAERLEHAASWDPPTSDEDDHKPTPPTTPSKGTPVVATTDSRVAALHTNLTAIGEIGTTATGTTSGRVEHAAGYYLAHILDEVRQLRTEVAALTKES